MSGVLKNGNQTMKNEFSHLTAKERDKISFPARFLEERGLLKGRILDFGCGFGKDLEVLQSKGYQIEGYDKHYMPSYPQGKFDTILCLYVLNVLQQEDQTRVLIEISKLLLPTGKAYFAVRRDLTYQGFRTHKIHQKPTFQCNVILPFASIFINDSCEIYEYTPINQLVHSTSLVCIFCCPTQEMELIAETASAYAIYDKYPVNPGHALIIPKRHVDNYFDLSLREQTAMTFLMNEVKKEIDTKFHPMGFNIGVNVGKVAGQSVGHVHMHLIPRYHDDVEDPFGGVRGVIPSKRKY